MDCSICGSVPLVLRTPRNLICLACYEGAKSLISLVADCTNSDSSRTNASKGFANAWKLIKEMKDKEVTLTDNLNFLSGLAVAFRDGIHTDIQLKPNDGPSIPAHRALLAVRSDIFKTTLESDGCKAPPTDTISLPELNHDELQSLLEFLYSGTLPTDKITKHVYSLYTAADKYEISFLLKFCEHWMLGSLTSTNALDILEISDVCPNTKLKDSAMKFVVSHMEDIIFTARYEEFALKNPYLNAQVTRALVMEMKPKQKKYVNYDGDEGTV